MHTLYAHTICTHYMYTLYARLLFTVLFRYSAVAADYSTGVFYSLYNVTLLCLLINPTC